MSEIKLKVESITRKRRHYGYSIKIDSGEIFVENQQDEQTTYTTSSVSIVGKDPSGNICWHGYMGNIDMKSWNLLLPVHTVRTKCLNLSRKIEKNMLPPWRRYITIKTLLNHIYCINIFVGLNTSCLKKSKQRQVFSVLFVRHSSPVL